MDLSFVLKRLKLALHFCSTVISTIALEMKNFLKLQNEFGFCLFFFSNFMDEHCR